MSDVSVQLSIIIVNWNSVRFLETCLTSIYGFLSGITFEVIVVDNASYDGSAELLRTRFPNAIFVQSDRNLGFSKGNNLGYKYSSGDTLLFLNPDTELLDDGVPKMYDHLHSSPSVGAVGCRLVNSDLTLQAQYVQAFPTIWNQLVTADVLIGLFPRSKWWSIRSLNDFSGGPVDVDVLAGSCLMVKRHVFEKAGRFNEAFFMYAEDVDLCYMIREAGYAIHYVGNGTVVHYSAKSSESTSESHFSSIMQRESLARFFRQRRGGLYAGCYRASIAMAAFLRIVLLAGLTPVAKLTTRGRRFSSARLKWTKLLRWSVGLEGWAGAVSKGLAD
jgi:GT2 family glycosyltransferase